MGNENVSALRAINLTIERGEFIALVGSSGSGKSTLMNILGCLDTPSTGTYYLDGTNVTAMGQRDLSTLRSRNFGFVFQQYHLVRSLNALANVETPAIYAGIPAKVRRERARQLLEELDLGERLLHRPMEMSGGQQQRVSIARALMNAGEILLADEPTGALDAISRENVLGTFRSLHAKGQTIILVTHDMTVAKHADRIVELRDGSIVGDHRTSFSKRDLTDHNNAEKGFPEPGLTRKIIDAAKIATSSFCTSGLRIGLSVLGISVGIVAVVVVVALGEGGQKIVLNQINSLSPNSISILPGKGWDDESSKNSATLTPEDAVALARQPYIANVSPVVKENGSVQVGSKVIDAVINGVDNNYFGVIRRQVFDGRYFSEDRSSSQQEAIIDQISTGAFFANDRRILGETVIVKGVPFTIVGIVEQTGASIGQDSRPQIYIPHFSMFSRVTGSPRLSEVVVRLNDSADSEVAEEHIVSLIEKRHGTRDFFTFNSEKMRNVVQRTSKMFAILVASIAVVALLVGGVGVMNIMLVSVSERTNEIGLRIAVGARQSDILMQFLIESIAITLSGSCIGVLASFGVGALSTYVSSPIPMTISINAVALGCAMGAIMGVAFGIFPAIRAASLKPVEALNRN
jgi:macrolide transport system ATP-binding/permease protein